MKVVWFILLRKVIRWLPRKHSKKSPVISIVWICFDLSNSSTHFSAVFQVIISLLLGELSTWQWEHAWLQYNPMFNWRISVSRRWTGGKPFCWTNSLNFGIPKESRALWRFNRSSLVKANCPNRFSSPAAFKKSWSKVMFSKVSGINEPWFYIRKRIFKVKFEWLPYTSKTIYPWFDLQIEFLLWGQFGFGSS